MTALWLASGQIPATILPVLIQVRNLKNMYRIEQFVYEMLNHFNINLHSKFVFQEHQVKDGTALEFLMDLLSTLKVLKCAYSVLSPGMCTRENFDLVPSFYLVLILIQISVRKRRNRSYNCDQKIWCRKSFNGIFPVN